MLHVNTQKGNIHHTTKKQKVTIKETTKITTEIQQ